MGRLVLGVGNVYQVDSAYIPPNKEYELVRFKDDSGKNELACFLDERSRNQGINQGDMVRINKITRATLGWTKKKEFDKNAGGYVEKWKQTLSLNVEVSKASSDIQDADAWINEVEGAELPWGGDLPL